MIVSAIVAVAKNNVMGRDNDIPWYLPADLKYFKATTLNRHIIMGRKTFMSIGRPLPKRTNVIMTRQPFFFASGCVIAHSIEQALEMAYDNGEDEVFIIGGGEIYKQSMQYWDRLYLTEVDLEVKDGDTFFPDINFEEWKHTVSDPQVPDEKNEMAYTFNIYERIPTK
ncbi:MAG: dihydrofolate reductase [Maribacter sp.]|jgi:dihydrofolate reductase